MIVKKVPARPAGRNATIERAVHARRLVDYLRSPDKKSAEKDYLVDYMLAAKPGQTVGERLFHIGGRGFVSTTIEGQRAEMIAIAQMATRSPNPVDHWILSWPEGELPEPDQIDAVVAMFVEHLGVEEQPCLYAVHGDTHNRHLHIALNRYDPLERRMVEINAGFNLEAAHQAVAIIVDRFGWRPEPDARYEVVGEQVRLTPSAQARIEEGREPIRPKAAAYENRTGYHSAQRIAQDEAWPIIAGARSWGELHARLAKAGMTYTPKGTNGVAIQISDEQVKASSVNRAITRARLEKRLGPFEPPEATLSPLPRAPALDRFPDAFRADEYRVERDRWRQRDRAADARRSAEDEEPGQRDAIAKARAAARAREDRSSAKPGGSRRPPPNLESWYYRQREGLFAERWRNRGRLAPFPALVGSARTDVTLPPSIDGYYGYSSSDGVRYARGPRAPTEFIDRDTRVDVVVDSDEALLAGLRLAALKMDTKLIIRAEPDIRDRILALAEANGLAHLLHEPEQQVARQTDVPAVEPPPSGKGSAGSADRTIGDSPPTATEDRPLENSNLPASSSAVAGEKTVADSPGGPTPVSTAPAALPVGNGAGLYAAYRSRHLRRA